MNPIKFYINNYSYINSESDIDIEFIPKLQRRRLNKFAKCTLTTLNKCFNENVTNIIFASRYGELAQLDKLITQYKKENEISPSSFITSLHNSILGMFVCLKKYNHSYSAQSASEDTIPNSLLSAVISKNEHKLFCYSEDVGEMVSLCINISTYKTENTIMECRLILADTNDSNNTDDLESLLGFLRKTTNKVEFKNYRIERL